MKYQSYEIPEYFDLEWYTVQKKLMRIDTEIARELMISIALLAIWKRKIGWEKGKIFKEMAGRKRSYDTDEMIRLHSEGWTCQNLAEYFDVSVRLVQYRISESKKLLEIR